MDAAGEPSRIVVGYLIAGAAINQQSVTPFVAAYVCGEFIQIAGAPSLRAVDVRTAAAVIQQRVVTIEPHFATRGDAAQLQLQSGLARQPRLSCAKLRQQRGADAARADNSHGQFAALAADQCKRVGCGWGDSHWQGADVHDDLRMKARARWQFGCCGESTPARLIEGGAVALKSYARTDTHPDVVVVVVIVIMHERMAQSGTSAMRAVETGP